jgi:SAM-dependent methyltransferase
VSFLELAAGPARHTREFARRGWRSVAVDLSSDMLKYAQQGAIAEGVKIETVCADMTDFTLEHPVTLAANLLESLCHLTTNEQVVDHLRAVSRNLLPGGIFVIQSAHPRDIWHDALGHFWTSKQDDGTEIDTLFGAKDDPYDWISQQWTITARMDIRKPGRPPRVVETHSNLRWYLPQELRALIDLSQAFSRTLWFGSMVVPPPPLDSGPKSEEMIVVLRK